MNVILIKLDLKGVRYDTENGTRVIKSKKLILLALIFSSILQSLAIVGQAWFFAILINNLIFFRTYLSR